MIYSNLYLNKKNNFFYYIGIIFSIIALFFIFTFRFFLKNSIPSRASKKFINRIEIVNLSFNQAGIYWLSEKKEKGWIMFGERKNSLDNIVFDERDTENIKNEYLNHYVLLKNLKPNKEYFFKIVSNNQLIDINGEPFSFKTVNKQETKIRFSPAYGKVIDKNGNPITNGVVILSFKDSYPLLSLIKISGEWLIPLNNIIEKEKEIIKTEIKNKVINLEIYDENGNKSNVEAITENVSPLPQSIIIGKDYKFIEKEEVLGVISKNNKDGFLIDIIYPKENSIIAGGKPLIKGLAIPNNNVYINLSFKNNLISYKTKADASGNWKISLEKNLLPGNYLIELITFNKEKKEVVLKRNFQIAKSGEMVLSGATESALLTPTPTFNELSPTQQPTQIILTPTMISTTIKPAGFNPIFSFLTAISFIIIGTGLLFIF